MTTTDAKLRWLQSRTYKNEHRKLFLIERAKDLAQRIQDAAEACDTEKMVELGRLIGAVIDEMDKMNMVEAEGYVPFAYNYQGDAEWQEDPFQHD